MVNVTPKQLGKNVRMSFGKITEPLEMPNLIEVQKNSYKWFKEEGLREVFREMTAITDYNGNLVLNFKDYRFDDTPKYSLAECKSRGAYVILISQEGKTESEEVCDKQIYIPKVDSTFGVFATAVILQLIAYYTSDAKGLDVDKPRNLAKSVTVE